MHANGTLARTPGWTCANAGSDGKDHPAVARDLDNLASLLQATNRLGEAEPLMRRVVVILLDFERATAHAHPHRGGAIRNDVGLLAAMGKSEAEIAAAVAALRRRAGSDVIRLCWQNQGASMVGCSTVQPSVPATIFI
jgi:hypothetical protein